MTDTSKMFPSELTEREAAAPYLDTDAMLAELHDLTADLGGDGGDEADPEDPEAGPPAEGDGEPTGQAPDGGGGGGEAPTPLPPAATPPGYLDFEGRRFPIEEIRALLTLNQRMKDQPELAQKIHQAIAPAAEAPKTPEWVDEDDPRSLAMWKDMQRVEQIAQHNAAQVAQVAERDRREHVVDSFRSAIAKFKTTHPALDDTQVAQVADLAGKSGIIDGLERSEGSLTAAFERGMEMTLWSTPAFRSLLLAEQSATVLANGKSDRKAKAAAVGSRSGGAAPDAARSSAKPRTRDEMMAAALDDVRNSLQE